LGACFLTRSTAIAFVPLLLIWLALLPGLRFRKLVRPLFLLAGFAVVATPYLMTLHRNLGTWTLDGYGMQFLWTATVMPLYSPAGSTIELPNDLDAAQRQQVAKYRPEIPAGASFVERNQLYKEQALKYVRENPADYAKKIVGKFLHNFALTLRTNTRPAAESWRLTNVVAALVLGTTYALFFAGLWVRRKDLLELGPLLIVIGVSIAVFTLYMSRVRYTLSIVPAMMPLIAFAADWLIRLRANRYSVHRLQGREVNP
jgi:hypothetical protein